MLQQRLRQSPCCPRLLLLLQWMLLVRDLVLLPPLPLLQWRLRLRAMCGANTVLAG
jgi:hypothetical protein